MLIAANDSKIEIIKKNCWEFKQCGRETKGSHCQELGICPAAVESRLHTLNGGSNGGRVCWAIAGTLCGGRVQGTFAHKLGNCLLCEFYHLVNREEGDNFKTAKQVLKILKAHGTGASGC